MKFQELAKKRYSCRRMSDQPVEDKLVEQIIATANYAPTAVNKQPFKIFWMKSDKAKDSVSQSTRYTFGANTFLVVGYKEEGAWIRSYDQRNFADVDASIVATHMMMEIEDLGLASTWVGSFDAELLKSLNPEMKEYELIAIFPIGYAREDDRPSHLHDKRKTREEIVQEL